MTDPSLGPALPMEVRIRFAHAKISHVLDHAGIRALHHKGHTAPEGTYVTGRTSTDADVLVPPDEAARAVEALQARGWDLVTSYRDGSIFQHAASLWHTHLGYADIHQLIPGTGPTPEVVFERLWSQRSTADMGGQPCTVPGRLDHVALIVVHAARDTSRGRRDTAHLRSSLSPQEWAEVRARALELRAAAPWVVATGESAPASEAEVALWRALRDGADRDVLLRARIRAAESFRERASIALGTLVPNRGHLRMHLEREPRLADYLADYRTRLTAAVDGVRRGLGR